MIKNKRNFMISLLLFLAVMALNIPFPHKNPYGEVVISLLNIPVRSVNGLHYVGIVSILLLITSFYLLAKSLKKYQGRVILLAIIIASSFPSFLVSAFQQTLATGINAVSYESKLSKCSFNEMDVNTLQGICELSFENYSSDDVRFTIEFYEQYYNEDNVRMLSLMNNNAPYEIELKGNRRSVIKIESDIDVSEIVNHISSGSATNVNIIMKSGEKSRNL